MSKGVRSPFTGVKDSAPMLPTGQTDTVHCGQGFPEEVTYVGDTRPDFPYDGTNFVDIGELKMPPKETGIRSPFKTTPMTKSKG